MLIILLSQIQPITLRMESNVKTSPRLIGIVRSRTMRKVRAKNKHITRLHRKTNPLMLSFPGVLDPAVLLELDVHLVGSWYDLQTAVFMGCCVDGNVGCYVLDAPDVVVGWGIQVGLEAVAEGLLVVDLVFEEEHFLVFELAALRGILI